MKWIKKPYSCMPLWPYHSYLQNFLSSCFCIHFLSFSILTLWLIKSSQVNILVGKRWKTALMVFIFIFFMVRKQSWNLNNKFSYKNLTIHKPQIFLLLILHLLQKPRYLKGIYWNLILLLIKEIDKTDLEIN